VILGPDRPSTGGYPVIAVVVDADLDSLAQLRPGDPVVLATRDTPPVG
jgi:allophanate hydrolase subunit 2